MEHRNQYSLKVQNTESMIPFESAEEAWFWFINAQQARIDGARLSASKGQIIRPCEPADILKILDRLYRTRRLLRDHLLVLRHYGRRQMAPDIRRAKEKRAATIWDEALSRIEPVLIRKKIMRKPALGEKSSALKTPNSNALHMSDVIIYKNVNSQQNTMGERHGY